MAKNTNTFPSDDPHRFRVGADQVQPGDRYIRAGSTLPTALQQFDQLPNSANVRLPVVTALFGCSAPTVWRRVKSGAIPAPRKYGGTTAWNVGELRVVLRAVSE
jgi:predicted DNA-binding transcriptional regulator AlpA